MSFDGYTFIQNIARRLIHEFEFSAGAGTPGLVGAAKECSARTELANLMPGGIAVGSGILVDSYGGVSKQQDIIIYEDLCPTFGHSSTPEATYYPVEGVIAAGEIKSTLTKGELEDAFAKSSSVKKLRRHAVKTDDGFGMGVNYRPYATQICFTASTEDEFNQDKKSLHQVYTFVLCEKFDALPDTMLKNTINFYKSGGITLGPNFIASLRNGFMIPHNSTTNSIARAAIDADGIMFCAQPDDTFGLLMSMVRKYVRRGKTVDTLHYDRYFHSIGGGDQSFHIAVRKAFEV